MSRTFHYASFLHVTKLYHLCIGAFWLVRFETSSGGIKKIDLTFCCCQNESLFTYFLWCGHNDVTKSPNGCALKVKTTVSLSVDTGLLIIGKQASVLVYPARSVLHCIICDITSIHQLQCNIKELHIVMKYRWSVAAANLYFIASKCVQTALNAQQTSSHPCTIL